MAIIEIMRAGTWYAMNGQPIHFGTEDLRHTAIAYGEGRRRAVLTIGHPPDDKPELGSVRQLVAKGQSLFAEVENIAADAVRWVREGRYKKISAAFFGRDATNNPYPDVFYLKHVGLLGATPPAVKGMKDPEFVEDLRSNVLSFAASDCQARNARTNA